MQHKVLKAEKSSKEMQKMAKQMFYCGKCDKIFTGQSMGI